MRLFALVVIVLVSWLPARAEEPLTLYWEDLLPEGEIELLEEMMRQDPVPLFGHGGNDRMMPEMAPVQFGTFNVVEDLDGAYVRIPGFVLPFEYTEKGDIDEFLLVPYYGACIHLPPPPPNQMVYVKADGGAGLDSIWATVWVIGTLKTERFMDEIGNSAYTLELERWEPYEE